MAIRFTVEFSNKSVIRDIANYPASDDQFLIYFCNTFNINPDQLTDDERKSILNGLQKILQDKSITNLHIKLVLPYDEDGQSIEPEFNNVQDFFIHYLGRTNETKFWVQYTTWTDMLTKLESLFINQQSRIRDYNRVVVWDEVATKTYEFAEGLDPKLTRSKLEVGKLLSFLNSNKNTLFILEDFDVTLATNNAYGGVQIRQAIRNIFDDKKLETNNSTVIVTGAVEQNLRVPVQLLGYFKKFKESAQDLPMLETYGRNVTAEAVADKLNKIEGRDEEIKKIISIFKSRKYNNVILLARPGVGKTALVEGLAQAMCTGDLDDEQLKNVEVFELNFAKIRANSSIRGKLEEIFTEIVDEVKRNRDKVIVFIDEIHQIMRNAELLNILKPHMVNGDFPLIGATTLDEFRMYIQNEDKAFVDRFQKVFVEELSKEIVIKILRNTVSKANVDREENLISISEKSMNYLYDVSKNLIQLQALPRSAEKILTKLIADHQDGLEINQGAINKEFGAGKVKSALGDIEDEENLLQKMNRKIIGQEESLRNCIDSIADRFFLLPSIKKPFAAMFAGPSGVGKTQFAKNLSEAIWKDQDHFLLINMGDGRGASAISGADPGYVGYQAGSPLLNFLSTHESGIIVLDEFEKSFEGSFGGGDIQNVLFEYLDKGYVTNNQGQKLDCKSFIFILTSNLAEDLPPESSKNEISSVFIQAGMKTAFAGRIDKFIIFNRLTLQVVKSLIEVSLEDLNKDSTYDCLIRISEQVISEIANEADIMNFGAREVQAKFQEKIHRNMRKNEVLLRESSSLILKVNNDGDYYFEQG